jgi:peptide/nickel transport system ATP-binding protein
MLEAENLSLALPERGARRLLATPPLLSIFSGVELRLSQGESVGIVGESGSGKTSLGRTLVRLYRPSGGRLRFEGRDIAHLPEPALRPLRHRLQFIFQDPLSALNPRRRIAAILGEAFLLHGRATDRRGARNLSGALLERVGLAPALLDRYPHQLSGGQRQRVGIARAIALQPRLVVADEITSGLDVSTQAQILALLRELRRELGLSLVFISHNLSTVRILCDRVLVMHQGRVVESGACADLFAAPRHPYTRRLLEAIPLPEIDPGWLDRPVSRDAADQES